MELIMKDHSSKWIEIFPSMITRAGEFYGIQMIARDITDRKLADIEMRKKLLKFNIDYGTLYLSKESNASLSLEVFKELLMVGNEGLLISRKPRKEFQDHIDHLFHHVKVSEIDKENHVKPEYKAIRQLISNIPRGEVIHIDCIEYLISWIGANKTIILIQYLKGLAMAKGLVVLVSIDPNAISEKELRLIVVIDPEGYIYEKNGNKETRIPEARVSLFQKNSQNGNFELWPAKNYQQVNPQKTDKSGNYSFLVTERVYKLAVSAEDYYDFAGKEFSVEEGRGVHENIALKPKSWWRSLFGLLFK